MTTPQEKAWKMLDGYCEGTIDEFKPEILETLDIAVAEAKKEEHEKITKAIATSYTYEMLIDSLCTILGIRNKERESDIGEHFRKVLKQRTAAKTTTNTTKGV